MCLETSAVVSRWAQRQDEGPRNGSACSSLEPWRIKPHPAALTKREQE